MITEKPEISLRQAALVGGITILLMAIIAPYCELYLYPRLFDRTSPVQTAENIRSNTSLLILLIFGYLFTFTGDVVVTWALYFFFKPFGKSIALLAALFRFVFSIIALVAILNLVSVYRLVADNESALSGREQLIFDSFRNFRTGFHFGIIFFSIHLILLGYLSFRSAYIPKWIGVVLVISGLGYLLDAVKPFLFPELNTAFLTVTFLGELIFMIWLLVKGGRMRGNSSAV